MTQWQPRSTSHAPHAQVEFILDGVTRRLDEADVVDVPFEVTDRVRTPSSWKHKRNYTGFYWAATTTRHVWFESLYERAALMRLDRDSEVSAIAAQPMWIHWGATAPKKHAPDFFVRYGDGTAIIVDVKPADQIKPEDVIAFDRTNQFCNRAGWGYAVIDDLEAIEVRNLRFLSGYRYARWRDDRFAAALREHVGESASLEEWANRLCETAPQSLGAVYSALWWQQLRFDISRVLSLATIAKVA